MAQHAIKVGEPYFPGVTKWAEGSEYNFRGGYHELAIRIPGPSRHEIEAVKLGHAEFGLFVEGDLIVLLHRFEGARGRIPWSDAPYSWQMVQPDVRTMPLGPEALGPESRVLLQVVLVDSATGIVQAIRACTFSPEFTRSLFEAIRHQVEAPITRAQFDAAVDSLFRRYPTTESMVPVCSVRCASGD